MEIYLDNAATTRPDDDVIDKMVNTMKNDYGNPSSKHLKGVESEKYLKDARENISNILKVKDKEIIFTSGGTESNNLAITGTALAYKRAGKHIITTKIEHDSVLKVFEFLEKQNYEVTYLNVDEKGYIDIKELQDAIRKDTILVSIVYVNNEIGSVQDIYSIGKIIKEKNPGTVFHVDAVQAFGKYEIYPKQAFIDLLSVSAHKIHGPKGVGFLYKNDKIKLIPQMIGGGQQKGMRSGTDNVPGICGMDAACVNAYKKKNDVVRHLVILKKYFICRLLDISKPSDSDGCEDDEKLNLKINALTDEYKKIWENSKDEICDLSDDTIKKLTEDSAPHIVSVTFDNIKSEVLLHALEEKGIYVSSGSACASNRNEISHVLVAIGHSKKEADSTLRFSFSKYNTKDEIDILMRTLKEIIPVLSKFISK